MRRAVVAVAATLAFAAGSAGSASPALAGTNPSRLELSAPATGVFGETVIVRARLTDGQAAPIAGARIRFVAPIAFLNGASDVVLAEGRTGKDGVAVGGIELRSTRPLAVRAVFPGDDLYAPAEATAEIHVEGEEHQVYAQHAGVRLPLLNEAPAAGGIALGGTPQDGVLARMRAIWPAMSGWPIAGALIVVWSLFAFAVSLLFRISAAGTRS